MFKITVLAVCIISCTAFSNTSIMENKTITDASSVADTSIGIYGFTVPALEGGIIDFSAFRGKKILIVNTASACGYTGQYKDLQTLYEKYKDQLVIIGFPSNDFGGQEPGSNQEIKVFCEKNYGVSFPMAAKVSVTGSNTEPIYEWLTHKSKNGVLDAVIKWNFNKFLLDEKGRLVAYFPSSISPLGEEIKSKL